MIANALAFTRYPHLRADAASVMHSVAQPLHRGRKRNVSLSGIFVTPA
jgi:hypothetical protein